MTIPIQLHVVRFQCPHCRRSWANGLSAVKHINRCWKNPAVRSCKTCAHFMPMTYEGPEQCEVDVDLTAPCRACEGTDDVMFADRVGVEQAPGWVELPKCQSCNGTRLDPDRSTMPIVHCELWEAS